jgi:hypothetical protein
MALQGYLEKTINGFDGKVVAKNVVFKVTGLSGDKYGMTIHVQGLSGSAQAFSKEFEFTPDLDGPNFIKQVYLHLKTLPEFEGAVDC